MSLRAWLPLDKDFRNYGADKCYTNASNPTTLVDGGKTGGKCAFFDNTKDCFLKSSSTFLSNNTVEFSFCCWYKPTAATTQCLFSDRSTHAATGFSIFYAGSSGQLYFDDGARYQKNVPIVLNQWNHVAVTRNSISKFIYINGVMIDSANINTLTTVNTNFFTIGKSQSSDTGHPTSNKLHGYLNDVRIYDHCLSAAEIHAILQGLFLHYPFKNYGNWITSDDEFTITRASGNTFYDCPYHSSLPSSSNTIFNVEYEAYGDVEGMQLDFYFRNSSGQAYAATTKQTLTTSWTQYSSTITGSPSTMSLFRGRCYGGTAGNKIHVRHLRVTSADMPYKDGIARDNSGFEHHGIVTGTLFSKTNSARYDTCLYINSTEKQYVSTPNFAFENIPNGTFNIWINRYSTDSTWRVYSMFANTFNWTANEKDFIILGSTGSQGIIMDCCSNTYTYIPNLNEWNMYTITWDFANTTAKMYVNGVLKQTYTSERINTTYASKHSIHCFGNNQDTHISDYSLSDARIYCTTLSDADVLALYNVGGKMGNQKNFHCYEVIERNKNSLQKSGIYNTPRIIEHDALFNEISSFSHKPTANASNSTTPGALLIFDSLVGITIPLTFTISVDVAWTNFGYTDNTEAKTILQGGRYPIGSNSVVWTGTNPFIISHNFYDEIVANSTGSTTLSKTVTVQPDWFSTFSRCQFGSRTNYSDGNGTISFSNLKVQLVTDLTQITEGYTQINNTIEI